MTKDIFAKGLAKAIPIVGGVLSGGITLVSMRPMGLRLVDTFDKSKFAYTEELLQSDIEEVINFSEEDLQKEQEEKKAKRSAFWKNAADIAKGAADKAKDAAGKAKSGIAQGVAMLKKQNTKDQTATSKDMLEQIAEAKEMLNEGIINEEEFALIKAKIING